MVKVKDVLPVLALGGVGIAAIWIIVTQLDPGKGLQEAGQGVGEAAEQAGGAITAGLGKTSAGIAKGAGVTAGGVGEGLLAVGDFLGSGLEFLAEQGAQGTDDLVTFVVGDQASDGSDDSDGGDDGGGQDNDFNRSRKPADLDPIPVESEPAQRTIAKSPNLTQEQFQDATPGEQELLVLTAGEDPPGPQADVDQRTFQGAPADDGKVPPGEAPILRHFKGFEEFLGDAADSIGGVAPVGSAGAHELSQDDQSQGPDDQDGGKQRLDRRERRLISGRSEPDPVTRGKTPDTSDDPPDDKGNGELPSELQATPSQDNQEDVSDQDAQDLARQLTQGGSI